MQYGSPLSTSTCNGGVSIFSPLSFPFLSFLLLLPFNSVIHVLLLLNRAITNLPLKCKIQWLIHIFLSCFRAWTPRNGSLSLHTFLSSFFNKEEYIQFWICFLLIINSSLFKIIEGFIWLLTPVSMKLVNVCII